MSSRRTVPDSSNRNTTTRPHRSDSNHTTQSTSSRGGGGSGRGGGGGTLSATRGGRGASYGNNSSSLNDNNNVDSSSSKNIQQQQQQPSSQQQHQQMMSQFSFQHHHQHQPFFHHPALGGFASSASASGQQTQQQHQGAGSNPNQQQQQNGAVTSPVASQHQHHHHHPHHHANYPAPNPSILTGAGSAGGAGAGGVPNHHIHSHHHFHHFLQQHHHIFAHHHHHHQHFAAAAAAAQQQQQQQAANSGNTTNNNNSNGVANNSSRNTPRSSIINNPSGSSSTPNTGGERNLNNNNTTNTNNVTSSGNGNLPLSVMGNTLMNNSNSNNNGPGSSTAASGLPPPGSALTASAPNPIYILNTANRDGETQVFDFKSRPIEHATSGNLATFLSSISPSVTTTASHYGDGSDGESYYMIPEMMLAFHAPFGVAINLGEVGVTLSESHPPERELYYTPQLSGFKFEIRAAEPPPINMTFGGKNNKNNNSKANSKIGTPTTSTDPSSSEPEIYQWYEDAKPEARAPLCNQFKELLERPEYARIKTLKSTECTVTSWFCVLWVPIHVKTHTPQASAGSFLVFYLVNPPSNMPNSRYRKGDPSCFYFRADPYSVSPLEFLNAPRFARACDAFASKSAPRIKKPKVSMLNSETLEKINTRKQQEDGEEKEEDDEQQQQQKDNQNNTEGDSNQNNDDEDENDDDVEMIEEIHDPPVQRMRIPVFGLIPCRISAEIWYARFSYYASNGMPVSCYAGPLFLLYCAMQLMNWEKARMTQFYMSKGKPLLEAHGLASVLPDYDHLMRHETRLNAFLNNYVC